MFDIGAPELLIILVIVAMLFGVGRLPEVFGAVGKGIREFRKEAEAPAEPKPIITETEPVTAAPGDKS